MWDTNGLRFEVIRAAAATRSPDAVPVLLALLQRAELPVAVAVLKAVAPLGQDKSLREKVVLEIVDTVKDLRIAPAGVPRPPPCIPWPEGEATGRYDALAPEMVVTLNAMTGRNLATPAEWFSLVAEHREKASELFLDK
jgi:hypothetical protein